MRHASVNAADLPPAVREAVEARGRPVATRPAPPKPKAKRRPDRTRWVCRTCQLAGAPGEVFAGWAAADRHALGHGGGMLTMVLGPPQGG